MKIKYTKTATGYKSKCGKVQIERENDTRSTDWWLTVEGIEESFCYGSLATAKDMAVSYTKMVLAA